MNAVKVKNIKIEGIDTLFKIKALSASEYISLMRKYSAFGKLIDYISFGEDLVFNSLISPEFQNKKELFNWLLPGQYLSLLKTIIEFNGFEV